jgi:hypothetical protein
MLVALGLCAALLTAAPVTELEDQFEKPQRIAALIGPAPVVIVAGDERATGEGIRDWSVALSPQLGRCRLYGLANLDGIPFFVPHSSVRSSLKEMLPRVPVLLDWDNDVYAKLGFSKGIELKLFARGGRLVGTVAGLPGAGTTEQARALLRPVCTSTKAE